MPAYNAAKTLERTYRDIPHEIVARIILVDDVSKDDTVAVASLSVLADLFGGIATDRLSKRFGLRVGRSTVGAAALLSRNLVIYGIGGIVAPFIGIKLIDLLVAALHLA